MVARAQAQLKKHLGRAGKEGSSAPVSEQEGNKSQSPTGDTKGLSVGMDKSSTATSSANKLDGVGTAEMSLQEARLVGAASVKKPVLEVEPRRAAAGDWLSQLGSQLGAALVPFDDETDPYFVAMQVLVHHARG
ncbi:unnamed protein product, partial [Amoebophrya sp. A120]|eukprot:GSA120T00002800001.1